MRSIWQTIVARLGPELARDIALVCLADGIVGLSFGAITVVAGLPIWLPMLLSVVVFAGASQFLFVAIIAAGGSPWAAMVAGLLVNARHLPFGLALGESITGRLVTRLLGAQVIIDESTAFALSQRDPARRRAAFWGCGIALFACWNVGVVIGAVGGAAISDTDALGLDAAFPAVLLALIMPSLADRRVRFAAIVGAVVAVAVTPLLPAGLPVLLSLVALPLVLIGRFSRRAEIAEERPGAPVDGATPDDRSAAHRDRPSAAEERSNVSEERPR